jgi:hypothetical protein
MHKARPSVMPSTSCEPARTSACEASVRSISGSTSVLSLRTRSSSSESPGGSSSGSATARSLRLRSVWGRRLPARSGPAISRPSCQSQASTSLSGA